MKTRETRSEPIVPAVDGKAPGFVVACLDCTFAHDQHAATAEDAVKAMAPNHDQKHHLVARPVDYTTGYGAQGNQPHPMYG